MDLEETDTRSVRNKLAGISRDALGPLLWTSMSWYGWINLNLDKPAALAELPAARACLDKLMELDPDYFLGPRIFCSVPCWRPGPECWG